MNENQKNDANDLTDQADVEPNTQQPIVDNAAEIQIPFEDSTTYPDQTEPEVETVPEPVIVADIKTELEESAPVTTTTSEPKPEPVLPPVSIAPTIPVDSSSPSSKKRMTLIAGLIVLVVSMVGVSVYLFASKSDIAKQTTDTKDTTAPVNMMGAELTIADGTVELSKDTENWQAVQTGAQITTGDTIRTTADSRAIISLDDGSAIRVDSSSSLKVASLATDNVSVVNQSGAVYTRVVPSNRQFSVIVAEETYSALGTAYLTTNTASATGVEVYQSSVKLKRADVEVSEGKYYYTASSDKNIVDKVADISIDKIKADKFLAWNYEQDKKVAEFKDKLGYLRKIDEKTDKKQAKAKQIGSIRLTGVTRSNGVELKWQLRDGAKAQKGFKILKGQNAKPRFGVDEYRYVESASTTSYLWQVSDGKAYHFRVCIYDGKDCSVYSNNVVVTSPKNAPKKPDQPKPTDTAPSGSLSLIQGPGKNFAWVLRGKAPKGYKLIWSTSPNPVYPGSDYQYYSSQSTTSGSINPKKAGTYYVRVCMYTGGGCVNYSNQIKIKL